MDHVFAKQVIREMKIIKHQLKSCSQDRDERWEDSGKWDNDADERVFHARRRLQD